MRLAIDILIIFALGIALGCLLAGWPFFPL